MSLEFTPTDRLILEKLCLERLCTFFPETLPLCAIQIDRHNTLTLYCPEPWVVDQLLNEMEALQWYAWITVGAYHIVVYYADEEICATEICGMFNQSHQIIG